MDRKFRDVPDELWAIVDPLLPPERPKPLGGRPPLAARRVLAGIVYRLRTGCQWKAIPRRFGSGSALHARFSEWVQADVFAAIHRACVAFYDGVKGLDLDWTALDTAIIKAPKGGTSPARTRPTARNPARNAA
jgi:transposase